MPSDQILDVEKSLLLIVDIQEAFLPVVSKMKRVVERSRILIEAANLLQLPVFVSQQYPQGLGPTVEPLKQVLNGNCHGFDKVEFSCCRDEKMAEAIAQSGRTHILLAGVETHVCIAQTALDLLALDKQPYVILDAVSARHGRDHDVALNRLTAAGAILTTAEAAILELTRTAKHPAFKAISHLIK